MATETQLRAEVISLRRSNASLTRRVNQLQALLGQLQPLWLESPPELQGQVQQALTCATPRLPATSPALEASLHKEGADPVAGDVKPWVWDPVAQGLRSPPSAVRSAPPSAMRGPPSMRTAGERGGEGAGEPQKRSPSPLAEEAPEAEPRGDGAAPAPSAGPASARREVPKLGLLALHEHGELCFHRDTVQHQIGDDSDSDDDSESDPAEVAPVPLGEVTVSSEQYNSVLKLLQHEADMRAELERKVCELQQAGAPQSAGLTSRGATTSRGGKAAPRARECKSVAQATSFGDVLSAFFGQDTLPAAWRHFGMSAPQEPRRRSKRGSAPAGSLQQQIQSRGGRPAARAATAA